MAKELDTLFQQDHTDSEQPTYVVFASRPTAVYGVLASDVARQLAASHINATVTATIGTWQGACEDGARIDVQTDDIEATFIALAGLASLDWLHVIDGDGDAHYVSLKGSK